MALKPYEDLTSGPLVFPICGKDYTVPEVDWQRGLRIRDLLDKSDKVTAEEQNLALLGDAFEAMKADGVPAAAISRAVLTALVDFRLGRDAAERVWESGLSPEALAPKTGAESTSTGEASTTPTADSTSGTTSPQATSKPRRPRASK